MRAQSQHLNVIYLLFFFSRYDTQWVFFYSTEKCKTAGLVQFWVYSPDTQTTDMYGNHLLINYNHDGWLACNGQTVIRFLNIWKDFELLTIGTEENRQFLGKNWFRDLLGILWWYGHAWILKLRRPRSERLGRYMAYIWHWTAGHWF